MNFGIKTSQNTKYYIYFRVSTQKQANDKSNGLDIQTDLCEKYGSNAFNIQEKDINYYCDIASSYNNKSNLPQLQKMLKEIEPHSIILIYDVSRLGRNTFQVFCALKRIKKLNSYIISVKDYIVFGINPIANKQFYHQVINAETDSDIKSKKTIDRIQKYKLQKIHFGRIPFGYKVINKKLTKNISEINIIKTLSAKYNELKSFDKVAEHFNKTKMLYRYKLWNKNNVKYLINKFNNLNNMIKKINNISI